MFPSDAVQRVRFIRRAQALGFSLQEICELLALSATRGTSCKSVRECAEKKIREIEQKIAVLEAMNRESFAKAGGIMPRAQPLGKVSILECLSTEKEMNWDVG